MSTLSNRLRQEVAAGTFVWASADVRAALVTVGQAADPDREFMSQITNEIVHASYARQALANKTATLNATLDVLPLSSDPLSWAGAAFPAPDKMVMFVQVTNDADSWIISTTDLRDAYGNAVVVADPFVVTPNATYGWLYL